MTESIYEFIIASIGKDGKIPYSCGKLPDDAAFFSGFKLGFVGGAFEGIMPPGKVTEKGELRKAAKLLKVVQHFADNPTKRTREIMYRSLMARYSISYLEPVMQGLQVSSDKKTAFYDSAKELVLSSPDRNVVKYALYFMCFGNIEKDKDIVITLAKHDEFTIHAIRAVLMGFKEANEAMFFIARHVDGWGKISAVEQLEPATGEIRNWLLRFGCANHIMDNYLAMICAEKGKLLDALKAPEIDRELFAGAGVILKALIEDTGPAQSIEDYQDGAEVAGLYLTHAANMCTEIDDLMTVSAIHDFLRRGSILSDEMQAKGWTQAVVETCKPVCEGILSDPKWPALVWEYVNSDDNVKNFKGRAAARKLGIDIWDNIFSRLHEIPDDDIHHLKHSFYDELASTTDPARFQKLVDFAEMDLPLDKIACGPGTEMGLGMEYKAHECLGTMLQNLRNRTGVGVRLIEAGLLSKVIRNRNMALSALETWDRLSYSTTILQRLEALRKCEPEKKVKERVLRLLKADSQ